MDVLIFTNNVFKFAFFTFFTIFIFIKSINYNAAKIPLVISCCLGLGIGFLCAVLVNYCLYYVIIVITILIISFYLAFITKFNLGYTIVITFIATMINIFCFIVSIVIISPIVKLPFINMDNNNPLILFIALYLEFFIVKKLFKIKRFENGFSFLKNKSKINNFGVVAFILSGNVILLYSLLKYTENYILFQMLLLAFVFIILGAYTWIKHNITLDYQDHMKNRKIELLESDLQSAQEKNKELTNEIQNLTMINHKYSSRIKAAEQEIKKLAYIYSSTNNTEISTELSDITKLVQNLSKEYTNELSSNLAYCPTLPKTNVLGVDILFEHLQTEAIKNNIKLELKINCSIKHLIEKFIPQNKLETLIGDHVKDAIIAINSGNKTSKNICVVFDIVDNFYRISFYDNGIDFKISTLVNLGLEAVTTHKDTGGSGMGFLTTFKTLSECKASLIIEEIFFEHSNFNKCITISFDGKSEYLIHSKRFSEIKQSDIHHRIKEHS